MGGGGGGGGGGIEKTLIDLEDEEIQKASSGFSDCLMLLKCRMIDSPEPSVGLMLLK